MRMFKDVSTILGKKPRTVRCLLCRGVVQLRNDGEEEKQLEKFSGHLENEHGAYFDHDFILATCFMDAEEKEAVKAVIDAKDIEEEEDDKDTEEGGRVIVKMEYEDVKEEMKEGSSHREDTRGDKMATNVSKEGPTNTCVACAKCEQRFEKTEHLRIHMKVIHTGATPEKKTEFYCEKCDHYYSRKDALRIHMSRRHTGKDLSQRSSSPILSNVEEGSAVKSNESKSEVSGNDLQCNHCFKTFTRKNNLNHHKKIKHENISETMRKILATPHHCSLCGKSFTRKDNLRYHNQSVHGTGGLEDMLNCRICDKNFTRRDNLNKHLKTMHNRDCYQCKECNFYTSLQEHLNQHMERDHQIPSSPKPSTSPLPILMNYVKDTETTVEALEPSRPTSPMDIIKEMWKTKNMVEDKDEGISCQNLADGPQSVVIDNVKAMWQVKKGLEKVEITLDETADDEEVRGTWTSPNSPPGELLHEKKATDVKVDTERSKYFRMNSYALSTLDEYTSGTLADFIDCRDLPSGWKFRFCGPPNSPEKSTHFITPDMRVVKSRLGTVEWLRLTGLYTRDQLWAFAELLHVPEKRFEKLF